MLTVTSGGTGSEPSYKSWPYRKARSGPYSPVGLRVTPTVPLRGRTPSFTGHLPPTAVPVPLKTLSPDTMLVRQNKWGRRTRSFKCVVSIPYAQSPT
jgi:hypothetical protein